MFQTSEPLSEADFFDTLLQQCGTVCRRQSQFVLSLETFKSHLKHFKTISHSAVDRVTDPHLQFDVTDDDI